LSDRITDAVERMVHCKTCDECCMCQPWNACKLCCLCISWRQFWYVH